MLVDWLSHEIKRYYKSLSGVEKNIDNAISFLKSRTEFFESAGKILDRMAELKALSQDVLKNS